MPKEPRQPKHGEGDDAGRRERERERNCNNIVRIYHCETEQNGQTRREKNGRAGGKEEEERNERREKGRKQKRKGRTTGRVLTTTTGREGLFLVGRAKKSWCVTFD